MEEIKVKKIYITQEKPSLLIKNIGPKGFDGLNGLSAYQIALNNGFIGTEQDWLNSLKSNDSRRIEKSISGENINSFKLVKNKNGLIYYASCDNIEDINRIIGVSITSSLINNELTYQLEGTIENMGFNFTPGSNLYLGLNGDIVENPNLGLTISYNSVRQSTLFRTPQSGKFAPYE